MTEQRRKIVVIAPSCDGTDVGEAWSGFQWVRRLGETYDVTVLSYRQHGRQPLAEQLPGVEVVEWEDLPLVHRWSRFNSMLKPGMFRFNRLAARWLRDEVGRGRRIDLVHQLTPIALRYSSPATHSGLRYVIGPLAGSLSTPEGFGNEMGGEPWYVRLRDTDRLRIRHDPFLRRTYENAEVVIGVAPYVNEILAPLSIKRFALLSETAVMQLPAVSESGEEGGPCRLLFVGRITRMKGVRDAIRAVARLQESEQVLFDIVGEGSDRGRCEREVRDLGIGDRVTFHGRVSRAAVDQFYRDADVFLFPSMREPSGNVVFEAMSFGLPLIVADRGGPGFVVDDSFGIRIPVTSPEEFAEQLALALRKLLGNRALRQRMGDAARSKVAGEHVWTSRLRVLDGIYREVLEAGSGLG